MFFAFQFVLCVIVASTTVASQTTQEKRQVSDKEAEAPADYPTAAPSFLRIAPKNGQPLRYQQTLAYIPHEALRYSQAPSQLNYGYAPQQLEVSQQGQYATQQASAPRYVTAGKGSSSPPALTFSPASEVSSFRFSSPIVTYSNLGVLSQVLGKTAEANAEASVTPSPQTAALQQKTAPAQQAYYTAAPQQAYSAAYAQPQRAALPSGAPKYAYAVLPQRIAYSPAPQQFSYQPESQQAAYAGVPQKLVYAVQPQLFSQKAAYVATPPRYVSGLPQQVPYSGPQDGAQQYAFALAPQNAQHSVPQRVFAYPQQYQFAEQPAPKSEKEDTSNDAYSQ